MNFKRSYGAKTVEPPTSEIYDTPIHVQSFSL